MWKKMGVTPFLHLHEKDGLCAPPYFCSRRYSGYGSRGETATAVFSSFNVCSDDGGGYFLWAFVSFLVLMGQKARNQKNQGNRAEGRQI